MVADLLQRRDRAEHDPFAPDALRALDLAFKRGGDGAVERRLLTGERAELFALDLLRQVADYLFICLQAAQNEGGGHAPHPVHRLLLPRLHGAQYLTREARAVRHESGHEEFHYRPHVADVILHGRACQRDVPVGADGARGARLAGVRVLDILGLVEDYPRPFHL